MKSTLILGMLLLLPSSLLADHDKEESVEALRPYIYQPTSNGDALTQLSTEGEYTMIVDANKYDFEDKTHANRHALRNARKKASDLLYIMNEEFDMHYTRLKLGAPLHVHMYPTKIHVILGGDHNGNKTRIMYTGKVRVVWKVLSINRYDYNYYYDNRYQTLYKDDGTIGIIDTKPRYGNPPGKITYGNTIKKMMRRRIIRHKIQKGSNMVKEVTDCLIEKGLFDKK